MSSSSQLKMSCISATVAPSFVAVRMVSARRVSNRPNWSSTRSRARFTSKGTFRGSRISSGGVVDVQCDVSTYISRTTIGSLASLMAANNSVRCIPVRVRLSSLSHCSMTGDHTSAFTSANTSLHSGGRSTAGPASSTSESTSPASGASSLDAPPAAAALVSAPSFFFFFRNAAAALIFAARSSSSSAAASRSKALLPSISNPACEGSAAPAPPPPLPAGIASSSSMMASAPPDVPRSACMRCAISGRQGSEGAVKMMMRVCGGSCAGRNDTRCRALKAPRRRCSPSITTTSGLLSVESAIILWKCCGSSRSSHGTGILLP
mmetsp:Transcript_21413/g.69291  ORF Transcript_21413/g.69291 Transcript_21413/m.69291 type:complete len:321 (-) Transcript_21413:293-1255(-)